MSPGTQSMEEKTYNVDKLTEYNYRSWSQVIESHLDDKDLWEVVKGIEKKPTAPATPTNSSSTDQEVATTEYESKLEQWTKKAKKARKMIISTITASVMTYVEGVRDPAEMWKILEERYNPKTRVTLRQLQRQFNTIKMEDNDGDMEKHLQQVERLKLQIEEQGEKVSESFYTSILLNSAPDKYQIAVSILENQDDVTPSVIINRLLEEYRKFSGGEGSKSKLAMLTNSTRKETRGNFKKGPKYEIKCNHCHRKGHLEVQCWIKHPALRSMKGTNIGKSEKRTISMRATTQIDRISKPNSNQTHWYLDSGASEHFSPHRHLFKTFQEIDKPIEVDTAEGTIHGTGRGSIPITVIAGHEIQEIILKNVLYVPRMASNLLSTITLYDQGYEVVMKPGNGITILKEGILIANSVREGSLFRLRTTTPSAMTATVKKADIETWHRRLGHLGIGNIRKLEKMAEGITIQENAELKVCGSCQEGKQHRQPSHKASTRAKEPGDLIHSDTCGPISPTSVGGANYFGLFIDDKTRMTFIVPLKGHTAAEMLKRFKEIQAQIETELGRKIKRLRTDGGGEYEKQFGTYLKQCGIVHEITAPYSPDQNGVSERANRTIVERVKSIIADGRLPKELWMEIASTVVYLKNRSPTVALSTTPYEAWYGKKPNLSHLRIIGSTVFVHVPKEKRIKLDSNSNKCTLVGYGGTNQYRVWDPSRKDVIVSRDVVFDEEVGDKKSEQAIIIEKPQIVHDSTTIYPSPPPDQLPTPPATEISESDTDAGMDTESETETESIGNPFQKPPKLPTTTGTRTSTRSNKGKISERFGDSKYSTLRPSAKYAKATINPDDELEPRSLAEAINHPTSGKQWEKAIQEEYDSIIKNKTWTLTPLPNDRKTMSCKWIFRHKKDENGKIVRLKTRCTACSAQDQTSHSQYCKYRNSAHNPTLHTKQLLNMSFDTTKDRHWKMKGEMGLTKRHGGR